MRPLPISIVIVSRDRPDWLRRCLLAVSQLDYGCFETIVVACPRGANVAHRAAEQTRVRVVPYDRPNISEARNAGIAEARGEVVAFLDDDAVPEPLWLRHLVDPFADPETTQTGGTTLGRNGLSVQHAIAHVDLWGRTRHRSNASETPIRVLSDGALFPRLHGTNMAIRRSALACHHGFDPRFAFYLDETDLSLRLSRAGGVTVFVPKAVVHHGSGPSRFRARDRTPLRLFEIGASAAVFHEKHTPSDQRERARDAFLGGRRKWLLTYMQSGALTPDDVWRLCEELREGYDRGRSAPEAPVAAFALPSEKLTETASLYARDICLTVDPATRLDIYRKARELVSTGARVSVFDYSPDARFHKVRFTDNGYWLHTGGIFGREMRSEPLFRLATRKTRVSGTLARLMDIRHMTLASSGN